MARRLTALVLLLMLVGCGRAPETTQVRQDLANRLAEVYGSGMFEIAAVDGRGSSADSTSPPGGERRVVYYDAELKPMRDIDLGAWNTPGVASLVTVLGAGPRGITGVKPGGNKAGDQILAHGTAIYRLEGDAWHEVTPASFTPPVAPALATISPPSPSDRLLTALHDAVHALPAGTTPGERAVIDQELERALAAIQSRLTRLRQGYPIAAGPERGQYVRFVQALQTAKPLGLTFQPLLTDGSVENLTLLHEGQVPLAMAQADIAAQASAGQGAFAAQGPFQELRALGSLYPEALHILVRANSPVHGVRDLMHKRVAVGSGSRVTAERVLSAYGMLNGRDYALDDAPPAAALAALGNRAVDAAIEVIGVPADDIRTLAAAMPLRLLPVDQTVLPSITAEDPALLGGEIPKGAYPGVDQTVPTVEVAALLVTSSSLSEAEAETLVKAIFGGKADLVAAGSIQGGQVGITTARNGVPIPFAAGAEAALKALSSAH